MFWISIEVLIRNMGTVENRFCVCVYFKESPKISYQFFGVWEFEAQFQNMDAQEMIQIGFRCVR